MNEEQSTSRPPLPLSWVSKIFQRMQGRYGSLWVDRWRTGEKDAQGFDEGVQNALLTWAEELAGFFDKPECIKYALDAWNGTFPPSLPEFREVCREYARRKASDALKLEHKLTPEEREQQKIMADKVAKSVKRPDTFDCLDWAKRPRSAFSAAAIFSEAKAGNEVMKDIFAELEARGVMAPTGKLLQRFDGVSFIKT